MAAAESRASEPAEMRKLVHRGASLGAAARRPPDGRRHVTPSRRVDAAGTPEKGEIDRRDQARRSPTS